MDSDSIKEGFLCPFCYIDFKNYENLIAHYQDKHSDQVVLIKTLKDVFQKAKNKILNKEQGSGAAEVSEVVRSVPGYEPSKASKANLGVTQDHTSLFKHVRTLRMEHYTAQTNNLVIRLGKLLENLPSDPIKRKAYEKQLVPWLDDKDVRLCPGCAKSFSILRRKHHCRLCGAVMCSDCTHLLSVDMARKMTSAIVPSRSDSPSLATTPKILRSPSSSSVQSVLSLDLTGDSSFRLCEPCHSRLQLRDRLHQVRSHKPITCQFYERLRAAVDEVKPLLEVYFRMHSSLMSGETLISLNDAHGVRVKILKLAEVIDTVSKKIAVLGQNTENPPQGVHLTLQNMVRTASAQFLKDNIIGLPNLPTEEELKNIQEKRRLEIARKIEENRRLELEAQQKDRRSKYNDSPARPSLREAAAAEADPKMTVGDSWTPNTQPMILTDDPMLEQIYNIQSFIEQAKKAGRVEEVETLERNLKELKQARGLQTQLS